MHVSAIYGRNFKPKIFTDITMPAKQSYSPNTGKLSEISHTSPSNRVLFKEITLLIEKV
jgi:hypothetical protein